MNTEKTVLFLFGVFFVVVMLAIAIAIPSPTEAQWRTFNLVLALVASSIAAMLPGVLQLRFTRWLRASGALAVFALVYLVKPAGLVAQNPFTEVGPPPPIEGALPIVHEWLKLLDKGDYEKAYEETDEAFRKRYAKDDFVRLGATVRTPLGAVVSRSEYGQDSSESQFTDRGNARAYSYLTQFRGASGPVIEVVGVFAREGTSRWFPAGYKIFPLQGSPLPPTKQPDS